MTFDERALAFPCQGEQLYGILSLPEHAATRGVLIIVGGPQYRAGSHRQFALLARHLAAQGIPTMRFDYRGMGDSQGDQRNFEEAEDDIRAAVDHFFDSVPGLQEVVIWGLCDAASAAAFYGHRDARVRGLVLLNPWVRTEHGLAQAFLKRYYFQRVLEAGLWRKILRGDFDFVAACRSFTSLLRTARPRATGDASVANASEESQSPAASLPGRMYDGLRRFEGQVMLILSGDDMTAQEFSELVSSSRKWRQLIKSRKIIRRKLPGANHTFSRQVWRDQVATWTVEWIRAW
ncbi:exosortase A-associated hydrolase 1 [Paucimonas lemoignei]|uniref:Exosortase A-associated hydrolase 1 n=1 Tax=Paucimonas lemoignei TaxID=29443 RepID=A0A4R3HYX3_PAULE|nr:hydrolase 1, exosortase A system-associated [Paucimonas lemoignei]TCS38587.1 exosortase A-associated hydrolase 1 [Paucimonas lemoignei]